MWPAWHLLLSAAWHLLLADICLLCSNGPRSPRQKLVTTTTTQHKADSESVTIQEVLDIFWPGHVLHGGDGAAGERRCLLGMQGDDGDFTAECCTRQDEHLPVGNWVSLAVVLSLSAGSDREHFLTIKPMNIGIRTARCWCPCCCCCKVVLLQASHWCCKLLLVQAAAGASCCCLAAASATSRLLACRGQADDLHT